MTRSSNSENRIPGHPQGETRADRVKTNLENLLRILSTGMLWRGGKRKGKEVELTRGERARRVTELEKLKRK